MEAILLVEDDPEISELVARYLESQQMKVCVAGDGHQVDAARARATFDLIILDLNLPGENGLSICRRLRLVSNTPIIILTAQGEEIDKVVALELGADDYVVKPFSARELLARIRAVVRRTSGSMNDGAERAARSSLRDRYCFSGWTLDVMTRQVATPDGASVTLTGAEFDLLHAFCEHPNRILTRDQLISMTHGRTAGPFERSVDILISRLRQRLEDNPKTPKMIKTVRSEGYMFVADVARA